MAGKMETPVQVADVIERFLSGSSLYPQEFNDFIDCGLSDPRLDVYRERCEMLHSEFEPRRRTLLGLSERDEQTQRDAAAALDGPKYRLPHKGGDLFLKPLPLVAARNSYGEITRGERGNANLRPTSSTTLICDV